jgi:mannose-6-phosphate isomerase-like protein (cupin superfamily)
MEIAFMDQNLTLNASKEEVFRFVEKHLTSLKLSSVAKDFERPWGGFFVIDEKQAKEFAATFFQDREFSSIQLNRKLSPKILIVQPNKRLSWQYHFRRSEIWKVIGGKAGVVTSETDTEGELKKLAINDVIELKQGQRHRLVGLDTWGIIAEIWQHSNPEQPSDEDDIVRVQDDFGR